VECVDFGFGYRASGGVGIMKGHSPETERVKGQGVFEGRSVEIRAGRGGG